MVNAIIERLLADDLRAVEGSYIQGELHVHDSLVNEVLQQIVRPLSSPQPAPDAGPATTAAAPTMPDLERLRHLVRIDELAFESRQGKNVIRFSVRR